ncbi:MAG TPA: DUF1735 domain-containing protein [Mucilaginibacter sp.]|jgi:hypothetical protein
MKKRLYLITTILLSAAALSLSSCLKDSRFVDLSKAGTIVEFPFGGQVHFGQQAVTQAPDTDAKGTIVLKFAVNVASATVPTKATNITFSVDDPAIIAAYNAKYPVVTYTAMPANAYVFTQTSITIPGGKRDTAMTVTFYKNLLDPAKSYMLPIAIKSAGGLNISGNMSVMYYHFIGNDFAGAYEAFFSRWNVPDTTVAAKQVANHVDEGPVTFLPVDPTTFKMPSGYYTGIPYTVSFTKTGSGTSATYSNWAVTFTADDIQTFFTDPGQGVVLASGPFFDPNKIAFDPNRQYSYAEALKLFRFYYTTASRAVIDEYIHL